MGPVLFSRRSRRARRKRRRPSPSPRLSAESRRATAKQRLGRVIVSYRLAPGNAAADRSPGGLNLRLGRRADASARFCQRSSTSVSRPSKSFSQSAPTSPFLSLLALENRCQVRAGPGGVGATRDGRMGAQLKRSGLGQGPAAPSPGAQRRRRQSPECASAGVFLEMPLAHSLFRKKRQLPLRISLLRRIFTLHCRL